MKTTSFVYAIHVKTTAEKCWEALRNPKMTRIYFFGLQVFSRWKVGAPIAYQGEDGSINIQGKILKYQAPRILSFSFETPHLKDDKQHPTRVMFELFPMLGGVKLLLTHDQLFAKDFDPKIQTLHGLNNGWPAILSNLKTLLETGRPCLDLSLMNPDGSIQKNRKSRPRSAKRG
jgi:uncharacterized protein YndB with AHSA1/START domain